MSNKNFLTLIFVTFLIVTTFGQDTSRSILKVRYQSTPLTQYNVNEGADGNPVDSDVEILSSVKDYYSLYVNLQDRSSIYILDSTVYKLPPGSQVNLATKVNFTLKSSNRATFKNEEVFDQIFFSEGEVGDISWTLTQEKKVINGLECYMAKAKSREWMLTAWYTKELPVSNGPGVYQGLPGLIVWTEDFFRTIELISVEFIGNDFDTQFIQMYEDYATKFQDAANDKYREKEPLLIVKKSDAANDLYEMIHGNRF